LEEGAHDGGAFVPKHDVVADVEGDPAPNPTQGMRSPVEGITLPIGDVSCAEAGDIAAKPARPPSTARRVGPDLSGILDLPRRQNHDLPRFDGSERKLPPTEGLVGKPRTEQVVEKWAGHNSADPARKTRLSAMQPS
jgi:hypothetical protein